MPTSCPLSKAPTTKSHCGELPRKRAAASCAVVLMCSGRDSVKARGSRSNCFLRMDKVTERERGVRVRIFTVQEELPFAGHPTLGTAFVLRGETRAPEIALDLKVGRVPVTFEDQDGKPSFGEMTQMEPKFGTIH